MRIAPPAVNHRSVAASKTYNDEQQIEHRKKSMKMAVEMEVVVKVNFCWQSFPCTSMQAESLFLWVSEWAVD